MRQNRQFAPPRVFAALASLACLGLLCLGAIRGAAAEAAEPGVAIVDEADDVAVIETTDDEATAEVVFECRFGSTWDRNYDGLPDYWDRTNDYPRYIDYGLVQGAERQEEGVVEIRLNGGGLVLVGPTFPIRQDDEYQLSLGVETNGLKNHAAWAELVFYAPSQDDDSATQVPLARQQTERVSGDHPWVVRRTPRATAPEDARVGRVILHCEAVTAPGDVFGTARFARVEVVRRSRAALTIPDGRFRDPGEPILATLELARGLNSQPLAWRVSDHLGAVVQQGMIGSTPHGGRALDPEAWWAEWEIEPLEPGFYRLEVLEQDGPQVAFTTLAIRSEFFSNRGGEFGWGSPGLRGDVREPVLREAIAAAGVGWVKLPMWPETDHMDHVEELVEFIEWLAQRGVDVVGVLGKPPEEVRERLTNAERPTAAEVFSSSPDLWRRRLEALLTHIALRVRLWQLGEDGDVSFSGQTDVAAPVARATEVLSRFGRRVDVAIGWSWIAPPPEESLASWKYLNLAAAPDPTAEELRTMLPKLSGAGGDVWMPVQPLPQGRYSEDDRVEDLFLRLAAAKQGGARMVFVPRPFDPRSGLVTRDGWPTELFVPWRTVTSALGGAAYAGKVDLNDLENALFVSRGEGLLLLWGGRPHDVSLDFGSALRAFDLWGREVETRLSDRGSSVLIPYQGRPLLVYGVSPQLADWQSRLKFAQDHVPIVPGVVHENQLIIENPFAVGVAGTAQIEPPHGWRIEPRRITFQLGPGERIEAPLAIRLGADAELGDVSLPIRVQLHATSSQEFVVHRRLSLGDGILHFDVTTRLNDKDVLEVEQILTNDGDTPVSFNFQLYAPARRQLSYGVRGLSRGIDRYVYRLPDASEFAGRELWIRGTEVRGDRVINHRVKLDE